MSPTDSQPDLRLAGSDDAWAQVWKSTASRAREKVADENRAAFRNFSLNPSDPRWALAVRAYSQLQGTTLTLERRQRMMRTARQLGIRPFDANIIIAIVQDHARRGTDLSAAAGTIALLPPPAPSRSVAWSWLRWFVAITTAVVANALLIWWLMAS
ncbi:MAG: hypothetical protein ACYS0G_12565 [Planctomycetota bacterium]|jgi:hypothetical protein